MGCELRVLDGHVDEAGAGVDVRLQGGRLRFYVDQMLLPESTERIATLEAMLASADERIRNEAELHEQDARAFEKVVARMTAAEEREADVTMKLGVALDTRAAVEAKLAASTAREADTAAKLAEALAELERLRRSECSDRDAQLGPAW